MVLQLRNTIDDDGREGLFIQSTEEREVGGIETKKKRERKERRNITFYFFGALNIVSNDVFSCSLVRVSLST